jgi:hypothetical protein
LSVWNTGSTTAFTNAEFTIVTTVRLGIHRRLPPAHPCTETATCSNRPHTRAATTWHGLGQCQFRSYPAIDRHNAVRDKFFQICQQADLNPSLEPTNVFPNHQGPVAIRPDIFIPNFGSRSGVVIDLCFTSPMRPDYIDKASKEQCYAASTYAKHVKQNTYGNVCDAHHLDFVAVAGEYFGGFTEAARTFILNITQHYAERQQMIYSQAVSHVFATLTIAQQHANALALLRYAPSVIDIDDRIQLSNFDNSLPRSP